MIKEKFYEKIMNSNGKNLILTYNDKFDYWWMIIFMVYFFIMIKLHVSPQLISHLLRNGIQESWFHEQIA
jgi:hypothetical protein